MFTICFIWESNPNLLCERHVFDPSVYPSTHPDHSLGLVTISVLKLYKSVMKKMEHQCPQTCILGFNFVTIS